MTSATKLRSSNLRSNWLRRSFLFALITQVVTVISVDDTADYPRGCRGGPVTVDGVDYTSMVIPEGSCAYTMKGYDADGTYRESVGVELVSNAPEERGTLKLELKILGDSERFDTPTISVETSGQVALVTEDDGVKFTWSTFSDDLNYRSDQDGYARAERRFSISALILDDGITFTSRSYSVTGVANSNGINLYGSREDIGTGPLPLSVMQKFVRLTTDFMSRSPDRKASRYTTLNRGTTRHFADHSEGYNPLSSTNDFYQDSQLILPPSQLAGAMPGFDGLGVTEAKVGDVLLELHKFRIELAQGIAQDLAAHHESIVDEIKTFVAKLFSSLCPSGKSLTADSAGPTVTAPAKVEASPPVGDPVMIPVNEELNFGASEKGVVATQRRPTLSKGEEILSPRASPSERYLKDVQRRSSDADKVGSSPSLPTSEENGGVDASVAGDVGRGKSSSHTLVVPPMEMLGTGSEHCSSDSSSPDHREEKAQKRSPRGKKAGRLSDGARRTSSVDMMRAKLLTSLDETTQMFQSNLSEPPPSAAVQRPLGGSQSSLPAEVGAEVEGPSKPIVAFSPPEVVEVADDETDANEKPFPVKSALESLASAYTVALQPKQTTSTGASSSRYGQRGTVRSTGGKSLVDRGQTLTQLNVEAHAKSLSLDDTSSKPVLGSGRWVVYPDGRFRLTWDVAGLLFIVYQGFVVPYTLSFETELRGFLADMDKCIDLYFMSDIALNFVTGYWNRGVLSLKHRDIARYYAQTWLLVDLVASIPFSWFISPDTEGPSQSVSKLLRVIRIVKFIRIARLLRLMRLKTLLSKLEEHIDSDIWLA
ncbi:hypothetical protein FOZ63_001954, partial [Perkinsus olseni]